MKKESFGSVNRRQFIRGLGLGAGLLTLGKIDMAQAALLPKAKRSEKFNVVVIGTGLAGMAAAVAAQNAGAKVAVLEKTAEKEVGGNSKLAGGLIAIPRDGSADAKKEYFEDFMKKSSGKGNAALTQVLADQSLDAVEWLKAQGCELTPPITVAGYRVKSVVFKPGAYKGMPKGLETLRLTLTKKGGKVFYNSKAKQLIMSEAGAVVGVRAADAAGLKDYLADAVIIAGGGYGGSREMLETFVDPNADEMMVRGVKTATGDGLNLAREAGAMWVNMGGMASVHVAAVSPKNTAAGNPFMAVAYTLGINKDGKRYVDESLGYVANGKASMKQPGQTVALLGATGSGKSSLISLIPRFYDVDGGRVTIDGVDVRDLRLADLRAATGVALQEAVLFSGTISDNIRQGREDASEAEIIAAAKAAQAHEFITALPDGYNTWLGQRGVNLSGGQKQRLAIARALVRQPAILILDDSTSAVDVETEGKIQAALSRIMRNRTSFIVAQRISTVLRADKILVLDDGRVVAEGTHRELMAASPVYREIYESQLGNGVLAAQQGAKHGKP